MLEWWTTEIVYDNIIYVTFFEQPPPPLKSIYINNNVHVWRLKGIEDSSIGHRIPFHK